MSDLPKIKAFSNVIPFPTVKEADVLREAMGGMELEIKQRLDKLQILNEDIVELTIEYEQMLHKLCQLTGVPLPTDPEWELE
tara:strand:- start:326 stop:571 length:246 start_codon:yes stop_codon:yes gene_type:complete